MAMTKFENACSLAKGAASRKRIKVNEKTLNAICKSLGPTLYKADAKWVAATDKKEIATIRKNFVNGKLKVKGDKADAAIDYAIKKIGKSNRHKHRAVFYYLIAEKLGKLSRFK